MKFRIVCDSSCNVLTLDENYATVPMKVTADREYVDDAQLDLAEMVEGLRNHSGKSGSACPNVGEWLEAFGDAEYVCGLTITRKSPPAWYRRQGRRTWQRPRPRSRQGRYGCPRTS